MQTSSTCTTRISLPVLWVMASFLSVNIACQRESHAPIEIREALSAATNVVLYSLNPDELFERGPLPDSDKNALHGYRVLGSTVLTTEEAKTAINSFRSSISDWAESKDACVFEPRHALRITAAGKTYDILLCYRCGDIAIYEGKNSIAYNIRLSGSPDMLNLLLKQAKVPTAKSSPSSKK